MTSNERKRFTVITNTEIESKKEQTPEIYHTNPLREKLMKFVNEEAGPKFEVKDLLKWYRQE